jgi:hypothetical protein
MSEEDRSMKISVSATVCFFLLALFYGTTQAQEIGTYNGTVTTTFNNQIIPAQETIVIVGDRLVDASGASNPSCGGSFPTESNRFNLKVVPSFALTRPGEIQIDSAARLGGPTSNTVLQYWCICDSTNQKNCGACYPNENLPPPIPFPPDAIRGCLVEIHETATNPPNLLAVPIKGGFITPMVIQKSATLTGTIDDSQTTPRLELNIKGTTVGGSFISEIVATKDVP